MSGVLIVGAGGHGKVVADILRCQGVAVLGFLDDEPALWGATRLGLPVLGGIDSFADFFARLGCDGLAIGIGANTARQAVVERLGSWARDRWIAAVHPRATVAASARLGQGVVVAAGAVVNPDTILDDYAIVNTGATVDHDCHIGAYAHVAPGAHLAGGVQVGQGTLVGVGASVIPCRSIGDWAVIGAGAAVVRDVPDRVTAKGVPARWKK